MSASTSCGSPESALGISGCFGSCLPGNVAEPERGRLKTPRKVNAVRITRFEYHRWPPRRPFFGGVQAAIASSLRQIVTKTGNSFGGRTC